MKANFDKDKQMSDAKSKQIASFILGLFVPFLVIFGLNELFGFRIEYSLRTWAAAMSLLVSLRSIASFARTPKPDTENAS